MMKLFKYFKRYIVSILFKNQKLKGIWNYYYLADNKGRCPVDILALSGICFWAILLLEQKTFCILALTSKLVPGL